MIRTAYLRVYLDGDAIEVRDLPDHGPRPAPTLDLGFGLTDESIGEDAITTHWQGRRFRCPRTPRLRILEGMLAVRAASTRFGSAPLFEDDWIDSARDQLRRLRTTDPGVSHILTAAWHVPMRWFVPFEGRSRELIEGEDGVSIRYREFVGTGLGRIDRAVAILDESGIPSGIVDEVVQLRRWLEDFDRTSMLELDYGSVARSFEPAELALDESVDDLWAAIDALADDDWEVASDRYGALVTRWALPMAVSYSN